MPKSPRNAWTEFNLFYRHGIQFERKPKVCVEGETFICQGFVVKRAGLEIF